MPLPVFPKREIERVAGVVASILKERVEGAVFTDPLDPRTWEHAARGLCGCAVRYDWQGRAFGLCRVEVETDDAPVTQCVVAVLGSGRRPAIIARTLVHELAHAILFHFAGDVFTDDLWARFDYCDQAHENIARCVERCFFGDFGHGWLPQHSYYWS